MESFFSRFKNALVLIAILVAQAVALATQIKLPADPLKPDAEPVRLIRLWGLTLVSPIERALASTGQGIRGAWNNYIYLRGVRQQNKDLTQQIGQLRLERAALSEEALEGKRLQTLLDFRQQYASQTVAAQVIGTSGSDQSRILTLDKGANDGLKPDMPVITPDGIVGKLRDVFASTSQLLLISDPTAGAGVILESTRIHAILRGSPQGRIQIANLTPDSRIRPGEHVLTSGGDGVFPRGLPVGTIESIAPDPDHQPFTLITLKPAGNITQLEEVLIVTGTGPALTPQQEQGTAGDVAQHAADVSAERLPSLHGKVDASGTQSVAGQPIAAPADASMSPADNSPSLVLKPRPALHSDRYTPGSAPPAAELTPGSPKSPN